jgi:hypothetical protein
MRKFKPSSIFVIVALGFGVYEGLWSIFNNTVTYKINIEQLKSLNLGQTVQKLIITKNEKNVNINDNVCLIIRLNS